MADLTPMKKPIKWGIRPAIRWGIGILGAIGAVEYFGRTSTEQDEANRAEQQNRRDIDEAKRLGIRPEVVAARRREAELNGSAAQEAAIQALIDADNAAHPGRSQAEKETAAREIRNRERDRLEALKLGTPTSSPAVTPTRSPSATMHGIPPAGQTVIGQNSLCRVTAAALGAQRQVTFQCDTATLDPNTKLIIKPVNGPEVAIDTIIENANHTLKAMVDPAVLSNAESMVVRVQGSNRPVTITFNENDRGVIRAIPSTP